MEMLKLYSILLLTFLFIFSSAQNDPSFVIKNGTKGYEMHIDFNQHENVDALIVNGFYSDKGANQRFSYAIEAKELFKKKNPQTKIHDLDPSMDYAFYAITIKEKDGKLKNYPYVKVNMPFENAIVKL